ncbi:MAG: hypothetical protein P8L47_00745, partial [Candidatus Marinamargulisbacteria bacterium]|nr:hypothetical protein [Candidatus Marinamargulisbacteria bacterium]
KKEKNSKAPSPSMKTSWSYPLILSALVALVFGVAFPLYWWVAIGFGVCSGLLLQTSRASHYARVRRETTLASIEKNLAHIQTALKKTRPLPSTDTPCIIVQEINNQKPDNERSYFVLTDTVSDVDWFNLMATTDQLKNADRIQAIFPSQPNLLSNRRHSHFISPNHTDKPFYFPSQLISFN